MMVFRAERSGALHHEVELRLDLITENWAGGPRPYKKL
jgi:hypothetical protein